MQQSRMYPATDWTEDGHDPWFDTREGDDPFVGDRDLDESGPQRRLLDKSFIRRKLGNVSDHDLAALVKYQGMPAPDRISRSKNGVLTTTEVWDATSWWRWRWQSRQSLGRLLASEWTGNVSATWKSSANYRRAAQRMVESRASAHGCKLSHTLTVGWKGQRSSVLTEGHINRWNDEREADVHAIARKLPRQVWRAVFDTKIGSVPDDIFLFVIVPERETKYGGPALWHLHIDLYLRPLEGRLFKRSFQAIKACVQEKFGVLSSDLIAEAQLKAVDKGFSGYCHKRAIDTIDRMHSNFLKRPCK